MTSTNLRILGMLIIWSLAGCHAGPGGDSDGDLGRDADRDGDAGDGDADRDGDLDADSDEDQDQDLDADAGDADLTDADPDEEGGCGDQVCDEDTQVCVHVTSMMIDRWECRPVPEGCEADRTCACLGDTCSPGPCFDLGPNQVNCIGGRWMSCPFLFLFDGAGWTYHTDLAGSVLGAGISIFRPQYYAGGIYRLGHDAPVEGVYRMQVRETIFEAGGCEPLCQDGKALP